MTIDLVTAGAVAVFLWGFVLWRRHIVQRIEASVRERLPVGAGGIVRGAEPLLMAGGERAVLLLHGFADTPQSLGYLASVLHARGWTVCVPLLPGHGRTLQAFAASRADDWLNTARAEYRSLRSRYRVVAAVGQSMGGALVTVLASEAPEIPAIVLLAPYLSVPNAIRRLTKVHRAWGALTPWVRGRPGRSILDKAEEAKVLGYGYTSPRLLAELGEIVRRARAAAPRVSMPTLVIQSRQDNRIPQDAAARAFALFGAPEKQIIWTEGNAHVVSVDFGREKVAAATAEWLEQHAEDGLAAEELGKQDRLPVAPPQRHP